jgi:hypothetical protein
MATDGQRMKAAGRNRWSLLLWCGAALLLSLPFIAMRFTREVDWSASDFIVMGIMLATVCGCLELAIRLTANRAYRLAVAAAIASTFLVIWINLAVGIVGSDDNPSTMLFFYALPVGIGGAIIARFRPRGMSAAMFATVAAIAVAFVIAVLGTTDEPNVSHWRELVGTLVITSPLLLSAFLFRRAARQ